MKTIYKDIQALANHGEQLLAVLVDPEKFLTAHATNFFTKVNSSQATHIFVGGSTVEEGQTQRLVAQIKRHTHLPIVLFPGDVSQITDQADALLFLSLISGRNPDYLIGKHVEAISNIKNTSLEIIPTGYILIENGKQTEVERVTGTMPMSRDHIQKIVDTAKAGELLGMKLMYLEAGSGAQTPITSSIIASVKKELNIPLIVGGGIRNINQLEAAYRAGADMVVIGTAFEEDESFFEHLKKNQETRQ